MNTTLKKKKKFTRRKLLLAGCGVALAAPAAHFLTQTKIRLGIVGVGVRGNTLAESLRWGSVFRRYGELVAVCDVAKDRAVAFREKWCPQAKLYSNYRQLIDREDIQGVIVATPDHWHAPITIAALHAGKGVYCEKPLAATIAEGKQIRQAELESGYHKQIWKA